MSLQLGLHVTSFACIIVTKSLGLLDLHEMKACGSLYP